MIVGVVREIKAQEHRVGLVPAGADSLGDSGHEVLVESGAGRGSGIEDDDYRAVGATILDAASEVWARSDLIVKVKEPLPQEYEHLRPGLILYTYLHLAPLPELTDALLDREVIGIAYETIELDDGSLPLLVPMSEIAGKMAVQVGAHLLEKECGGRGVLLGGVPGVSPADVVIIGGGIVGRNAARVALGMGASVTVLERSPRQMERIDTRFDGRVRTVMSNSISIEAYVRRADLLVGAVLIPGASAPTLVSRQLVSTMKPGSVIVDVAVDQGGCIETTRPTTHNDPSYVVEDVVHYGVANMPGAVPRTSTFALTNVTTPYLMELADEGVDRACRDNAALASGVNTYGGRVTCRAVAESQDRRYTPLDRVVE